jgi:hypothetical protein
VRTRQIEGMGKRSSPHHCRCGWSSSSAASSSTAAASGSRWQLAAARADGPARVSRFAGKPLPGLSGDVAAHCGDRPVMRVVGDRRHHDHGYQTDTAFGGSRTRGSSTIGVGVSRGDGSGVELADDKVDHCDVVRLVRYLRALRSAAWMSELRPSSSPLLTRL